MKHPYLDYGIYRDIAEHKEIQGFDAHVNIIC